MSYTNPVLIGGGPSGQSIRTVTTSAEHAPGTVGELPDGRKFRYASHSGGTALAAGQLCQAEAIGANFINANAAAAVAVGETAITVTLNGSETVAANAFAGGYVTVNDDAGEGLTYAIESNAALTSGTALSLVLAEGVAVALTTSSEVVVYKSPWTDVTEAGGGHVHFAAGVPQVAVPAGDTATQYFWMQTAGPSGLEDDAATAVGSMLQSGTTAGQSEVGDGTAQSIGTQLVTGVAGEHRPSFLGID